MPINNITQTISTIPEAGRRGVDVQTVFVTKQEDFQDHLAGTTIDELNTLKDQLNTRIGEINSTATTMNGYADTASAGASTATTKAGEASASASEALTSRNQAETFKNNASASATKASQWADNNYNVEVETGKYSAKHWATVAQAESSDIVKLTGNQTIGGIKTFSSNIVGSITGNSATATTLANSREINGVLFDGSANISVGLDNQSGLISSSFQLDNTNKNRLLVCSGTFNITLPTEGTLKAGDLFIIDNIGTGTLSLVTNGNYTDLSRLTVLAGEVLILQSDGGTFYRFVSRSKDFASNMSTIGYTYLPNGLIMQWGRSFTPIAPGGTLNITFPIAFPTDIFYSDVAVISASINNNLYTPFVIATTTSNLAITNNDIDSSITQIRWFAIGY